MLRLRTALLALLVVCLLPLSAFAESRSSANLSEIADTYYWALQERLLRPNFSTKANTTWDGKLKKLEYRLARIKKSNLDPQSKITYNMLNTELTTQRKYISQGWIKMDVNGTESPMQTIAENADTSGLRTVHDWRWVIKTLEHSTKFMGSYTNMLESGLRSGRVQTREAVQSSISSLKILSSKDPKVNPFLGMEANLVKSLKGKKMMPALRQQLRAAVNNNVIPAHQSLRDFLEIKYLPKAAKLGSDRETYLYHMARHLGPDHASPEALHEWGRSEVERLHKELLKTVKEINPKAKSLSSFMSGFNRAKGNQYKDANAIVEATYKEIARERDLARKQMSIPRSMVGVKPVASHQEATVAAQYYPNGDMKGVMEVNTGKLLKSQRRSDMATLVTHEIGGHHVAAMYAQKQTHLPSFRTEAANTVFDEGWALYAEQLRDEQKGFKPKDRVGFLVNHLWRASRLVVDTGLHTGQMSQAQARDYFKKTTFVSKDVAKAEISRYIDWPAQALAYYVGKKQILEIRAKARKTLGKKFNPKTFHAKLLSFGAIPLAELRKGMETWANRSKGQFARSKSKASLRAARRPVKAEGRRARAKAKLAKTPSKLKSKAKTARAR